MLCTPPGQSHLSSLPWTGAEQVNTVNNIKKRKKVCLWLEETFPSKNSFNLMTVFSCASPGQSTVLEAVL